MLVLYSVMRAYFASLDQSAHPNASDPRSRAITRFQELLLISFREFSVITDEMILHERKRFRNEIIHNIESFSKRAAVRNLKTLGRFNKEQAGLVYDALYKAMCIAPPPPATVPPPSLFTTNDGHEEKPETRIGLSTFGHFLSEIATWARDEKIVFNGLTVSFHLHETKSCSLMHVSVIASYRSRGCRARVYRSVVLLLGYVMSGRAVIPGRQRFRSL